MEDFVLPNEELELGLGLATTQEFLETAFSSLAHFQFAAFVHVRLKGSAATIHCIGFHLEEFVS